MLFDQLHRRELITLLGGAASAWPLAARAQQSATSTIGFVSSRAPGESAGVVAAFRQGIGGAGFVEGQNLAIAFRWAEGRYDRLPALVAELVNLRVAVIFAAGGPPSALAAKEATSTIPVVFSAVSDPVRLGLVPSLNRPGGNVTGISFISVELGAKRLGLLRELLPGAAPIAVLVDPKYPLTERFVSELRAAALAVGQQLIVLDVSSDREIETAFTTLVQRGAGALVGGTGGLLLSQRERVVALAARHRIPAIYYFREAVAAGGLMSYAPSIPDAYRQAGIYAGRILKGEKPGDLPVMLPTKFEFVINVKTAKALSLEIPDKLLALADEVIE